MENPFVRIVQRGFQAMVEATQEELGRMSQQLIQGILTPDSLGVLMGMMQQSLGGMGFDVGKLSSLLGRQPGFDPYRILGLDKSASDDEVKKRYRELMYILHPDKSQTSGTSFFFQMVLAAYEMIKQERGWQ